MSIPAQAVAAAIPAAGGLTFGELLSISLSACGALIGTVAVLWKLDRGQLLERIKDLQTQAAEREKEFKERLLESDEEARKNYVRYEHMSARRDAAVADVAGLQAELAREQGRRESLSPKLPLPPPSIPRT